MRVLQQVGAVLGGEAVRLPAAVRRGRGRRHGCGEGAQTERRAVGRRRGGGGGGEAVAEKSGEHWSWRRDEGAEVGEDRCGSGGGHVGCAPSDTCLPPASARHTLASARPARLLLVCVRHFVLGLASRPCGLLCSPYIRENKQMNFKRFSPT